MTDAGRRRDHVQRLHGDGLPDLRDPRSWTSRGGSPPPVDNSAYARLQPPTVHQRLGPLLERGLVATCPLVDLEILYCCRTPRDYEDVLLKRRGFGRLDIEQADWDTAADVQRQLARTSRHQRVEWVVPQGSVP